MQYQEHIAGRYISEREAAIFLGVSRKALQSWRAKGVGPRFAKFGRAVRYNVNELTDWADSQQHTSTASVTTGGV